MGILYGRLDFQAVWDNTNVLPKSLHVSWSHSNNGIYFPIIESLSNPIPLCLYHFPGQSSLEHREAHDFGQAVVVVSIRFPQMVFAYESLRGSSGANNRAVFLRAPLIKLSVCLTPQQALPHPVAYQGAVFVRYVKANVGSLFV